MIKENFNLLYIFWIITAAHTFEKNLYMIRQGTWCRAWYLYRTVQNMLAMIFVDVVFILNI